MKGGFLATDLSNALCAEYDVAPNQALADVEATIASWKEAGVIE